METIAFQRSSPIQLNLMFLLHVLMVSGQEKVLMTILKTNNSITDNFLYIQISSKVSPVFIAYLVEDFLPIILTCLQFRLYLIVELALFKKSDNT